MKTFERESVTNECHFDINIIFVFSIPVPVVSYVDIVKLSNFRLQWIEWVAEGVGCNNGTNVYL